MANEANHDACCKKAYDAGARARKVIDAATGEVSEITEEVQQTILKKPVQSTLIALGAGVILGMLLRRR